MMRLLIISVALGVLLNARQAAAQTAEIQQKVTDALAQQKEKTAQNRKAVTEAPLKDKTDGKDQGRALEDMLAQALKDNPDIRVAESKLREVEAELNRVRLLVTQKVIAQQREIAQRKAALTEARATFARLQQLSATGAVSVQALEAAKVDLQKLQADLARLEDELPFLLGHKVLPSGSAGPNVPLNSYLSAADLWLRLHADASNPPPQGPKKGDADRDRNYVESYFSLVQEIKPSTRLPTDMADRLRKALDAPIKVDFQQASPKDILDFLQQHARGINIVSNVRLPRLPAKSRVGSDDPAKLNIFNPLGGTVAPVDLHLTEMVPLGAVFQFLEDHYGWRFVIRDYGIVIAEPGRIPPGAVYLQDFWKNRPTQASTSTTERKK